MFYDEHREEAIRNKRYSQIAGFDGISTGLQIALNHARYELKALPK